jgi:hypothetical protein
MSTFLDLRSSQGASAAPLSAGIPIFAGALGLQVAGAAGNIRVYLEETVGISQSAVNSNTIIIQILRNIPVDAINTTYHSANVIYSQTFAVPSDTTTALSMAAADFNPPSAPSEPGQINYSLWVTSSGAGAAFNGPQTFIGMAAAD